MAIISEELREVRDQFAVPRRTEIVDWSGDMEDEDLIEREDMVVTITASGYAKRTPLAEFRAQKRGGKGTAGMATKEEDVVTTLFVANTHTPLLFFTTDGMVYKLKTWRLPQGGRTAKGKALVNLLPIPKRAPGSPRSCPSTATRITGTSCSRLRHRSAGDRAAQPFVGFHQRHAQRQDRDEVRGRDRGLAPHQRPDRVERR